MANVKEISRSLAGFVASALMEVTGNNWAAIDEHPDAVGVTLCDDKGAKVFVRIDGDRVVFTGTYPKSTIYPSPKHVSITAKRDKSPAVIARDIARRLLPEYLAELARVQAGNERDVAGFAGRQNLARELQAATPQNFVLRVEKDNQYEHSLRMDWYRTAPQGRGQRGELRTDFAGDLVMEMQLHDLTPDQAKRILQIVAED